MLIIVVMKHVLLKTNNHKVSISSVVSSDATKPQTGHPNIAIVISKFIKRELKAKRGAPAYS